MTTLNIILTRPSAEKIRINKRAIPVIIADRVEWPFTPTFDSELLYRYHYDTKANS